MSAKDQKRLKSNTGKNSAKKPDARVRQEITSTASLEPRSITASSTKRKLVKPNRAAVATPHPLTAPKQATEPTKLSPDKMSRARKIQTSSPTTRRSAAPDALNFIVQGMDKWWSEYVACLDRFLKSASGKNVHDIRVAIRHLSTIFDLVDRFNPDNMVRRARAKLKAQQGALGSLRDAHVEMVRMRTFLKEFPEMKPFHDELLDKEAQQLKKAKKIAWKSDRKFIVTAYNRAMLRLNARRATSSGDSTRRIIDASIDVLFDNLSKRLEKVTLTDYASIHRVRLSFRPLRYTLELLQPLLGLETKQLRISATLARTMGRIQDLEVLMKDLVESNWRKERVLSAVAEIWLSLENQKTETAQRFVKAVPKFGNIWKPIIHEQPKVASTQPKTLLILRHGIAVSRGDAAYPLDSDRPLTAKGIKRMGRIASGMRRMRTRFDLILSSPYRRALESAFVLARAYEVGESVQTNPALKPEVLAEEVVRTLIEKYSASQRTLLVGHEPQLSALISTLTSGSAGARPLLKKGGLCKLQVDGLQQGKCATLMWLLTPKQLMSIA